MSAIGLVAVLVLSVIPNQAWAAVVCPVADTAADSDNDGFTDFQECNGITLADGVTFVPTCPSPLGRSVCLDPNSKDLFVIYAPAASGSLLPSGFKPFVDPSPLVYGVTFRGLTALGITVHQIVPGQAATDRTVMHPLLNTSVSTQKAVSVAESLDTNGTFLGYCQWGTPNGLDGCTVFTQRIKNFIASTCGANAIVTSGAGSPSDSNQVFLAYATHTFLHETGHTTGGMTAAYNSSWGGNHYAAATSPGSNGAGTRMEQYVTYSTKGGKCKFNIPTDWDASLDPQTIKLR